MSRVGLITIAWGILSLVSAGSAMARPPLTKLNGTTICVSVKNGMCITCAGDSVPIGSGSLDATDDQCPTPPAATTNSSGGDGSSDGDGQTLAPPTASSTDGPQTP